MTRREWLEIATGAGILAIAGVMAPVLTRSNAGAPATPAPTCEIPCNPTPAPTPDVVTPEGKKMYRHGCGGLSEKPPEGPAPACGMAYIEPPKTRAGTFTDRLATRHGKSR